MIPLNTDRPIRTTSLITPALIMINVAVALIRSMRPGWDEWFINVGLLDPNHIQLWTFITHQFLHADIWHLLGNMLFLWVFGQCLEDRFGKIGFTVFYLIGGIIAGLAHCLISEHPVLGASGAISAVTGAFLALFPRTRVRILWLFILITIIEIPSLWFIGFNFGLDIFNQIRGGGHVAYMAHISGNIFGFAVGMGLLYTHILSREPYDLMTTLSQWNRRRRFTAVTKKGSNPWTGEEPNKPTAFNNGKKTSSIRSRFSSNESESDDPALDREALARKAIVDLINQHKLDEAIIEYKELIELNPKAVLSESNQLDIANTLFKNKEYETAAHAWQRLLETYPTSDQNGQIRLMLSLTLTRYLNQHEQAKPLLDEIIKKLHTPSDKKLAEQLLSEINETNE